MFEFIIGVGFGVIGWEFLGPRVKAWFKATGK